MLSDHLSSLRLPPSELLVSGNCTPDKQLGGMQMTCRLTASSKQYRIPHLPDLLRQPCYRCSRYLKVPDGMPYGQTGLLSATSERSAEAGATEAAANTKESRWVCWHTSCGLEST